VKTPAVLYVVATPIGNLGDITERAINILRQVDLIAAEDTRHSKRLLEHLGIHTPMKAFHNYNEEQGAAKLLTLLQDGKSIALISDAGTPLISDPGYRLVSLAREQGIAIHPIPGACALIAALSASGLPSDRFVFEGFLSAKSSARCEQLKLLADETRTIIFYESPHRILSSLADMIKVFGEERPAVIGRELTKTFETIKQASLKTLLEWMTNDPNQQKGEFVIVIKGFEKTDDAETNNEALRVLKLLLAELPIKQASHLAAKITGAKKNWLYEKAIENMKSS
jgi:16S rRNA (cytidine1402-2'-O)-methyltransferase